MRHQETEVKFRVADLRRLRKRLKELGFRREHPRSLEDNLLFDTPSRTLRSARSILRLRRYGSRWFVTYKGTPKEDQSYKSRVEYESEVSQPGAMRKLLEALGFVTVFRYQKYRSQFVRERRRRSGAHIEVSLDETPIGDYVELEGSRRAIDKVARQLGFARRDYCTASYGALYLEYCKKRNRTPGDMVFSRGKGKNARPH